MLVRYCVDWCCEFRGIDLSGTLLAATSFRSFAGKDFVDCYEQGLIL